jgi:hypothetical protein
MVVTPARNNPFSRANSVSSNISSAFAQVVEITIAQSSPYFKFALITTIISIVLADIAPVAIQVEVGLDPIPASFLVPALPTDSIYSNYSEPFFATSEQVHPSIDIAPVYFNSVEFGSTWVKAAPPAINALAPRPNIVPGQGYRYLTDVYVHFRRNNGGSLTNAHTPVGHSWIINVIGMPLC